MHFKSEGGQKPLTQSPYLLRSHTRVPEMTCAPLGLGHEEGPPSLHHDPPEWGTKVNQFGLKLTQSELPLATAGRPVPCVAESLLHLKPRLESGSSRQGMRSHRPGALAGLLPQTSLLPESSVLPILCHVVEENRSPCCTGVTKGEDVILRRSV